MKPVFGINLTNNAKNDRVDGDALISVATESYYKELERSEPLEEKKLPWILTVLMYISCFAGFLGLGILIDPLLELGIAQAYATVPWAFWMAGLGLLIFIPLTAKSRQLGRENTEALEKALEEEPDGDLDEEEQARLYAELGVPNDAEDVDLMMFSYKETAAGIKVIPNIVLGKYYCFVAKLYVENDCLCIADVDNVKAIPLSDMESIVTVHEGFSIPFWNKELPHDSMEYAPYGIMEKKGKYYFGHYHILKFRKGGEEWGLCYPPHEKDTLERLTGLLTSP